MPLSLWVPIQGPLFMYLWQLLLLCICCIHSSVTSITSFHARLIPLVSTPKTGLLIMIDQLLISPQCVTKDIYHLPNSGPWGEIMRCTLESNFCGEKKSHPTSSASQRTCWKLGVMRSCSVTAFWLALWPDRFVNRHKFFAITISHSRLLPRWRQIYGN